MISTSGLSQDFCTETMKTACCLINLSPSSAISFKTPHEMWYGRVPNYMDLRIFGCVAYAHVKQDKLQPRAKRCIFLGYPEGVKGYMLWCIVLNQIQEDSSLIEM